MVRKYSLYIGIACVLAVSVFMSWAKQQVAYEHIKNAALKKLTYAEHVAAQPYMPTIEIANHEGNLVSLPEKGQFMLINLWSAKCKECIINLSTLKQLQHIFKGYGENWKIIGVSVDKPKDLEQVTKTIKKYNISEMARYYDARGSLQKFMAPKSVPVTIIVNNKGRVLYKIYGSARWLDSDVISFLRAMPHVKDL